MIMIAIGLLLGSLGLLWITVIAIIQGDRDTDRRNLPHARGAFRDKVRDDTRAA
jgi:hypothetical protein